MKKKKQGRLGNPILERLERRLGKLAKKPPCCEEGSEFSLKSWKVGNRRRKNF